MATRTPKKAPPHPPPPAPKIAPCRCGGDHGQEAFAKLDKPLQEIIECSRQAANDADTYQEGLSTWIAKLTPAAAAALGWKGPDFMGNVDRGLEKLMRDQADMQSAANRKEPRDVQGGIFHGGIRGRVQEAQHQIARARASLSELKKWDAQQARKKQAASSAGGKYSLPPKVAPARGDEKPVTPRRHPRASAGGPAPDRSGARKSERAQEVGCAASAKKAGRLERRRQVLASAKGGARTRRRKAGDAHPRVQRHDAPRVC